jgi:hypothetical protein
MDTEVITEVTRIQDNLFAGAGVAACARMACVQALAKNGVI